MDTNKTHWYDGFFYEKFIAPNQDKLFAQIRKIIEPNSDIIDIGCGTGRFSFSFDDSYKSIMGIDLSKRNLNRAKLMLSKKPKPNVSFHHKAVSDIIDEGKLHFDYAVLTYVIHEVDEKKRVKLLNEISQIADKIIIGDYMFPQKLGLWKILNEAVEFAAGKNHYRNYKSYMANGGISKIALHAGLKIIFEIKDKPLTSHLVVLSRK